MFSQNSGVCPYSGVAMCANSCINTNMHPLILSKTPSLLRTHKAMESLLRLYATSSSDGTSPMVPFQWSVMRRNLGSPANVFDACSINILSLCSSNASLSTTRCASRCLLTLYILPLLARIHVMCPGNDSKMHATMTHASNIHFIYSYGPHFICTPFCDREVMGMSVYKMYITQMHYTRYHAHNINYMQYCSISARVAESNTRPLCSRYSMLRRSISHVGSYIAFMSSCIR